jgi:pyruvate/2-oxoglutarate dehydrogenase complex dihydrolipoamide dehydrogenase (E3) component
MEELLTPDICVIGGGSGGLSVAAAAAAFGVEVVLVEKGAMGGDCLNYGCVPSKALIAAAKHAHAMRESGKFGIAPVEPSVSFARVHDRVHEVIAEIAPNDSVARFTALGVRVIEAHGRFIDKRTLVAGEHRIQARRFVIATGSSAFVPPVPGIGDVDVLTNESVFNLKRLPGHLLVMGGGPIGMELAQAFHRLGSRVTVLEAQSALGRDDPELASIVLARVRAEGVDIRERTRVMRAERRGKTGVRLHLEGPDGAEIVDGTHLLVAAGRAPNVEGLGLKEARVRFDGKGIRVGATLRTSNRRIYAIGDVAGGLQFTHVAGWHAGLVIRPLLFRLRAKADTRAIPRATYTDPELAQVGLTEADAVKAGHRIQVLRWPFSENDRAVAEGRTAGLVKIVADRRGRILGTTIAGAGAGEMIALYALAVSRRMKLRDLVSLVVPYPTMAEAGKRAAVSAYAPAARKPAVRRLVRFLSRFG